MTVYTQMLPKEPIDDFQTEELELDDRNADKGAKTSYSTFHSHFENVCKRQKISDDFQGKTFYRKFNLTFDRLSYNSV